MDTVDSVFYGPLRPMFLTLLRTANDLHETHKVTIVKQAQRAVNISLS